MADINGDALANLINGTSGDDRIFGFGGNDNLNGRDGSDQLFGGDGDDSLHGDAGADLMFGGAGNDTYYVDDINDVTSEETVAGIDDGGTDRVYTTVSYVFAKFIERATLIGTAIANLLGNTQDNSLTGNTAANILTGGAGKDTLAGGGGTDTFVFGAANATSTDKITDFSSDDSVAFNAADFGLAIGAGLVLDGLGNLVLDASYFANISGSTNTQGTVAGHGQFLFNTTSRALMWDADGSGSSASGIAIATFNTGTALSASQIKILGSAPPVVGNISINDVSVTEGNAGTTTMTFTVSRSGGTAAFSINYETLDGSATLGANDYLQALGQISFAENQTAQTIQVTINGDTLIESNENLFVNLSGASSGTIIDAQGVGTILNDDSPAPVVGDISINDVTLSEGNAGTKLATFTVSRTGTAAFAIDYATANGTATASSDYVSASGTLNFSANQTSKTFTVTINGDTIAEANENFSVNLTGATGGTVVDAQGIGTISNDDSPIQVVRITDMRSAGSPDPSGLAYVPGQGLFVSDSEVDETPFSRPNNLFKLTLDGTLVDSFDLRAFTAEPTGLAYDSSSNRLYISDDDRVKLFWVDASNPTAPLGQINLAAALSGSGVAIDAEDVAVNRTNGNIFIVNGLSHSIVELTSAGVQVGPTIILPTTITDPEAIVYDHVNDVFYVGGDFSANIWKVDRQGNILDTITVLAGFRNPVTNTRVHVKDIELAPTSNPNDNPLAQSMYVADYGNTHLSAARSDDGRLFEINIGAPDFIV
jgi:hypothetical protein